MDAKVKKMLKAAVVVAAIMAVFLAAILYTTFQSVSEDKQAATVYIDGFYEKMMAEDYEATIPFFHERFLEVSPGDKTVMFLGNIDGKLGKVESYELADWGVEKYVGREDFIYLYYNVKRERYDSQETFTLYYEEGASKLRIYGYDIRSTGLVME